MRFPGADLLSCSGTWSGTLGPQFNETEQDLVPLPLQLLDRARSDFGMDAFDELLLHLRSEHRRAEGLPPGRHRATELLEEVLNAARPTAQVIEHHVAHDAPAQAWTPGEGSIDVGGAHHTLGDKVVDLARQRTLQAVGDVPRHFLVEAYRPLSDRGVELRCAPDCLFGGLGSADDFD